MEESKAKEMEEELETYHEMFRKGRLISLPCSIGDKIWSIQDGELESYTVVGISMGDTMIQMSDSKHLTLHCRNNQYFICISAGEFGNMLFHEKGDAEQALRNNIESDMEGIAI